MSTHFSNMNQKKLNSLGSKFFLGTHIFSSRPPAAWWCIKPGSPPVPGPPWPPSLTPTPPPPATKHPSISQAQRRGLHHLHHLARTGASVAGNFHGPTARCTLYRGLFHKLVAFWKFCLQGPLVRLGLFTDFNFPQCLSLVQLLQ